MYYRQTHRQLAAEELPSGYDLVPQKTKKVIEKSHRWWDCKAGRRYAPRPAMIGMPISAFIAIAKKSETA